MTISHLFASILFIFSFLFDLGSTTYCPNGCSGRGICPNSSLGACQCFPGFHGVDCSIRLCPAGTAWYAFPSANSSAHPDYTECSNMGHCDRSTGLCKCRAGFTGPACNMMQCPLGRHPYSQLGEATAVYPCSGNGRCISLREASSYQDYVHFYNDTTYDDWDADMIYGCACDSGYEGFDCSKKTCPKGDDPLTQGVDEVQVIDCVATTSCSLYFTFQNQRTAAISCYSTASLVKYHLEQLSTIEKVSVDVYQYTNIYPLMCSSVGSAMRITFHLPTGPQPNIIVSTASGTASYTVFSGGSASTIHSSYTSVRGTKEYAECSNRGICLNETGTCNCYKAFSSSDGLGNKGTRGDCGYRQHTYVAYSTSNVSFVNTTCPFFDAICSGHGTCNENTGQCTCDSGYGGTACANRTCSSSLVWFGDTSINHTSTAVCGGVGECDGNTGLCFNCGGNWRYFNGTSCEYLTCPVEDNTFCSGHGVCLSLREMGLLNWNSQKQHEPVYYDAPWDADAVRGCVCERAISIDNQYSFDYTRYDIYGSYLFNLSVVNYTTIPDDYLTRFYRGPYAFAATDYKGYDCTHMGCPTGDNPFIRTGLNEIQQIHFHYTSGHFTLSFRNNETYPIYCNDTLEVLGYRLEQLHTIHKVLVYRSLNTTSSLCDDSTSSNIFVEFLTELGDLPLMTADSTHMTSQGSAGSPIVISEYQRGTKLNLECSGQGICREETGICSCRVGFRSSNGSVYAPGERGDCTYQNPFQTTLHVPEEVLREREIKKPPSHTHYFEKVEF